jgi:hypothetical protein
MAAGNFGIGVVSSLEAGYAQKSAGQQQQAAYNYNANIDLQDTSSSLIANEQRYSTLVGKQATAYAAAGVDITSGSPLLMMAATAGRGGRQAAEIYQSGTEKATLEQYYGKVAAWRGTMAGVGSFLSGISSAAQQYLKAIGYDGDSGGGSDSGFQPSDINIAPTGTPGVMGVPPR